MASKTRSLISSCPEGKWAKFIEDKETADELVKNLK
jgi:hypothetical protein